MPVAPSVKNYAYPGGVLFFDQFDVDGNPTGARHLGNAPEFKTSVEVEKLTHYSSMGGIKQKDFEVPISTDVGISMTLEEVNSDNLKLLFMGSMETVSQAADDDLSLPVTASKARYFDLGKRNVGSWKLIYDGGTAAIAVGDTITGSTSSASAEVLRVVGTLTSGTLYLSTLSGTFQDNEDLQVAAVTKAVANGTQSFDTTDLVVSVTGPTFFTKGSDFTVDSPTGRIYITEASTIPQGAAITVQFGCAAATWEVIHGFQNTSIEGRLTFIAKNAHGPSPEIHFWRVSLSPTGDQDWIGEELQKITLEGAILKDEAGHPDSPFCDVILPG